MKKRVAGFFAGKPLVVMSFVALILLASCMDDDKPAVTPVPLGFVSIYHAAPEAPAVDIVVDNNRINSRPFEYSAYSGYLNFYTGDRNIRFNALNASSALIDTTFNVAEGKAYSLFLINNAPGLETLIVTDSSAAPATGKAMVRFVHLSPDAPAFDFSVQNGSPLFAATSFKGATQFTEIDANRYTFELKGPGSSEPTLSAKDVEIRSGGYYTVVVRGFSNPPTGNNNLLSLEVL